MKWMAKASSPIAGQKEGVNTRAPTMDASARVLRTSCAVTEVLQCMMRSSRPKTVYWKNKQRVMSRCPFRPFRVCRHGRRRGDQAIQPGRVRQADASRPIRGGAHVRRPPAALRIADSRHRQGRKNPFGRGHGCFSRHQKAPIWAGRCCRGVGGEGMRLFGFRRSSPPGGVLVSC